MNERIYYSAAAEERANRERTVAVLVFMGLGLAIGAVLALLFAPKSGEQIRSELTGNLEGSLEGGREATNKTIQRLEKDFGDLRKRIEERLADR